MLSNQSDLINKEKEDFLVKANRKKAPKEDRIN
jgi:hypothetical protein